MALFLHSLHYVCGQLPRSNGHVRASPLGEFVLLVGIITRGQEDAGPHFPADRALGEKTDAVQDVTDKSMAIAVALWRFSWLRTVGLTGCPVLH